MKIMVITGDHFIPDLEKPLGRFEKEEFKSHQLMADVFNKFTECEFNIINNHENLFEQIQQSHPDMVVNFCDTGYKNQIKLEPNIPAYLELFNIPFTGASASSIILCYDKTVVYLIAESINIPVPKQMYFSFDDKIDVSQLVYPMLIKPNAADGSFGITKDAVVHNSAEANHYLSWLKQNLPQHDLLIQEFLNNNEYSVGLIGNPETEITALPILEVDYSGLPQGLNPILAYESKSIPDSPYWTKIQYREATSLDSKQQKQLIEYSIKLFKRLKLRDYARIDFRKDNNGIIKLLEVNPNPAWCYDGKLALMARFSGMSYDDFLRKIIDAARQRVFTQ